MDYQWYPGHMTKARRRMQENIRQIDLVIELTDARCVLSGRNPDIDELAAGKARLLILTKSDLADERANRMWIEYYQKKGILCALIDGRKTSDVRRIRPLILEACREKIERDRRRGIKNRPVRAMIAGIPNVGKSTFINALAGKSSAKTGNRPGVTKGEQWIRPDKDIELLDTPGILWPKFEDQQVGMHLALTGTIRDEILEPVQMAGYLAAYLQKSYPQVLPDRYAIPSDGNTDAQSGILAPEAVLSCVAENRSMKKQGGEPDLERAARALIEDFRSGRLGKISLEFPDSTD